MTLMIGLHHFSVENTYTEPSSRFDRHEILSSSTSVLKKTF
jgi:hypothetical protein